MTDRLIRITTALAVIAVAAVAAIISYQLAYELVRSHGEFGMTARLLPFTVDGLIWAASMVVLDASRRNQPGISGRLEPGRGHPQIRVTSPGYTGLLILSVGMHDAGNLPVAPHSAHSRRSASSSTSRRDPQSGVSSVSIW